MSLRLPKEIERYVASLMQIYKIKGIDFLQQLLANAKITIEEHSYDNLDGGQYGFLLRLLVPDIIFAKLVEVKDKYESEITNDLNKLIEIRSEFIDCVSIEMQLSEDDNWREKSGFVLPAKKHVPDNAIARIWKPAYVRVFITHKAEYKHKASKLKDELERYGISCFVAHKDIEPTKEWIQEIENALFSMDLLIALMSKAFHDSNWTDQEVGVAVGRHIPVIPIKIGKDPYGFIGKYQALSGTWTGIPRMAKDIFGIIVEHSATREKIKRAAISAFKESPSFADSKFYVTDVLPHFKKLDEQHVEEILSAFNENCQIRDCFSAQNRLPNLLYEWTGDQYHLVNEQIVKMQPQTMRNDSDDIPF
ncbi:toll/interleukin-1 receptor domain-containing protein [Planctomycetota bacterium]